MNQTIDSTDLVSFQALWRRCLKDGVTDNSSASIYQQLIQAYNEPQRVYHTMGHIEGCFAKFEEVRDLLENPDALALAIWFHDAIYELGASDNEQRSADLFMTSTDGLFDDSLRERVYAQIMVTLHCGMAIEDYDSQYMVDIDLSSFGMPWPIFLRDSMNVRSERPDMSDEDFYTKQCGFQKSLLERPRFFQSEYFHEHYEKQARKNLTDFFALIDKKITE